MIRIEIGSSARSRHFLLEKSKNENTVTSAKVAGANRHWPLPFAMRFNALDHVPFYEHIREIKKEGGLGS
jgi:hypothetical protein